MATDLTRPASRAPVRMQAKVSQTKIADGAGATKTSDARVDGPAAAPLLNGTVATPL